MQALILCCDPDSIREVRRVLNELKILAAVANGPERARELLAKQRFDAMVVDCDDLPGATDVLKDLRQTPSNKRCLAFAVVNGATSVRNAYDLGANFVLDKPLNHERVLRSFRAAHGLMMRERRRYYRNPLIGSVQLLATDGHKLLGRLVNLSEGGMAVEVRERVARNTALQVTFSLPHSSQNIQAKAEVSWTNGNHTIGLRFLHVEQRMQRELEDWVAKQGAREVFGPSPVFINATAAMR